MFTVFTIIFVIGIVAIIKGGLPKLKIPNRKVAVLVTIVSLVLASITLPSDDEPNKEITEADEQTEEAKDEEKEESKEKLSASIESVEYNKDEDAVIINLETNLPDETEIDFTITKKDTDDLLHQHYGKAKVKDGNAQVKIEGLEDELYGKLLIANGDYEVSASVNVNKEREYNLHLLNEFGEFEDFIEKYEATGEVGEWDDSNGYHFELTLDDITIEGAYSEEEVTKAYLEKKKENAETIDYKQLEKNPDRHTGEYVKYSGEIIQIMEGSGLTQIRLALDDWGDEVLFVEHVGYTDFVEGDKVTVYGEISGAVTYTSQAGWEITIPGIIADVIE